MLKLARHLRGSIARHTSGHTDNCTLPLDEFFLGSRMHRGLFQWGIRELTRRSPRPSVTGVPLMTQAWRRQRREAISAVLLLFFAMYCASSNMRRQKPYFSSWQVPLKGIATYY